MEQEDAQILESLVRKEISLDSDVVVICKRLIHNNLSKKNFHKQVKSYSRVKRCAYKWKYEKNVFRCYTCSFHPSVILCGTCFDITKHEGHNFKKIKSSGGCCDCGDDWALDPYGFCNNHGYDEDAIDPPDNLFEVTQFSLPLILVKILQAIWDEENLAEVESLLTELREAVDKGDVMQNIVTNILLNQNLYFSYFSNDEDKMEEEDLFIKTSLGQFCGRYGFNFEETLTPLMSKDCMLDSFYMVCIGTDFETHITEFLLSLFPQETFRSVFAKNFALRYSLSTFLLTARPESYEHITQMLKIISTQILSSRQCVKEIVERYTFMETLISLLHPKLMTDLITDVTEETEANWPPVADFLNVLFHYDATLYFVNHHDCVNVWLRLVNGIQGLQMNQREITSFVSTDRLDGHRVLNIELHRCIMPIWAILLNTTCELYKEGLDYLYTTCLDHLKTWVQNNPTTENTLTFNLPLHRILTYIVAHNLNHNLVPQEKLLFDDSVLNSLLEHPLRLRAGYSETMCGFWVKNGTFMLDQADLYKSSHFSSSAFDPDLFLLQVVCSQLDPAYFVERVLTSYHTLAILKEPKWQTSFKLYTMIEEVLFLFSSIISGRMLPDANEDIEMKNEYITILSISEHSKSEILNLIPEKGIITNEQWTCSTDTLLKKVADLKAPVFTQKRDLTKGVYHLKDKFWLEAYDPVLVRMKCASFNDYTESLQKFYSNIQKQGLKPPNEDLWPPFRPPTRKLKAYVERLTAFLHSDLMHAFIYVLLHNVLKFGSLENILYLVIHLLHMMIIYPHRPRSGNGSLNCRSIYENCLVPFDMTHNVLSRNGLASLFSSSIPNEVDEASYSTSPELNFFYEPPDPKQENLPSKALIEEHEKSNETIITMLLKLYKIHAKTSFEISTFEERSVRVGGGKYFIGEVLNSLVAGSEHVRTVVEDLTRGDNTETRKKAALERKKKAAKEKLKKEMEKKRALSKKFLGELVESDEEVEDVPICCVCSQPATHSDINPPCYSALVSRTNIMGRRTKKDSDLYDPVEDNFAYYYEQINLNAHQLGFEANERIYVWYDGIWMLTCAHVMHFECYTKNLLKLQIETATNDSYVKEFWCPFCRQLCNSVLPVPLDIALSSPTSVLQSDYNKIEQLIKSKTRTTKSIVWHVVEECMLDNAHFDKEHFSLFANSLRMNIEIELMNKNFLEEQKEKIDPKSLFFFKPSKKLHLGALYNLCRNILGEYNVEDVLDSLQVLNPIYDKSGNTRNIGLCDVKMLLTTVILSLPEASTDDIVSVIIFFFNLFVIQLLAWIVVCTDEKKIMEWIEFDNLADCQLGFIISTLLNHSKNFRHKRKKHYVDKMSKQLYSRSEEFLRYCVLLFNSVVRPSEVTVENIATFKLNELLSILLGQNLDNKLSSIRCFGWTEETLNAYLFRFCQHTNYLLIQNKNFKMMKTILTSKWKTPNFISLPNNFKTLYDFNKILDIAEDEDVMVCLICHQCISCEISSYTVEEPNDDNLLVNFKKKTVDKKLLFHANTHHFGTCMLIGTKVNYTCLIWQSRLLFWNSLYKDKYGEEDIKYKRGKELYLDEERLHFIRSLWVFNAFDVIFSNHPKYVL